MFDKIKEAFQFAFTKRYIPSADRGKELLREINITKSNTSFRIDHNIENRAGYAFHDYSEKEIQDISAYFVGCGFSQFVKSLERIIGKYSYQVKILKED